MIQSVVLITDDIAEVTLSNGIRIQVKDGGDYWVKISAPKDAIRRVQSDLISPSNPKGELKCLSSVAIKCERIE